MTTSIRWQVTGPLSADEARDDRVPPALLAMVLLLQAYDQVGTPTR